MRALAPNPNVPENWAANPRHVLMDLGFLLQWMDPESEADDWAFLKASPGLDPGSARQVLSFGVFDRAQRTREMTFCNRIGFKNHALAIAADDAAEAVHELLDIADLLGPVGERYPAMLDNDLMWPLLYWQMQQAYRRVPSEHKAYLDQEHGEGSGRFLGCNGWTVWSLEDIRRNNPWLAQHSIRDQREIWLREIEMRVLYLKRSDYAVFWQLRYVGTPTLKRGVKFTMDRFGRYGLRARYGSTREVYIGWANAADAVEANDKEIIGALTWLRCLVPVPLDPFTFGEPDLTPKKLGPRALPPEPAKPPRSQRDIETILRTPTGKLNASEIADAQRHFGLPEEPAPRYHPEKPPMLPKYIRLFREAHPGLEMRAGWQERLKDLRRDAERAGAYEGLHYNARERKRPYAVHPPQVTRLSIRGARPGITRELRQRLQPMLDEITGLRQAVLLAYEDAEASRRKKDYEKAVELDGRLDALEADVDDALEQLGSEADPLEPGPTNVLGGIMAEGDEPMGFLEGPERALAVAYDDWLKAQRAPGPASRFHGDTRAHALAEHVRQVLWPYGELREDLTDTELVEAARDAHEAETLRRARIKP